MFSVDRNEIWSANLIIIKYLAIFVVSFLCLRFSGIQSHLHSYCFLNKLDLSEAESPFCSNANNCNRLLKTLEEP